MVRNTVNVIKELISVWVFIIPLCSSKYACLNYHKLPNIDNEVYKFHSPHPDVTSMEDEAAWNNILKTVRENKFSYQFLSSPLVNNMRHNNKQHSNIWSLKLDLLGIILLNLWMCSAKLNDTSKMQKTTTTVLFPSQVIWSDWKMEQNGEDLTR